MCLFWLCRQLGSSVSCHAGNIAQVLQEVVAFQKFLSGLRGLSHYVAQCLQKCIAALEGLAQVVLFVLGAKEEQLVPGQLVVAMAQLCDNQGIVAASAKMLSLKKPLDYILQALGFFPSKFGTALHISHVAGDRNVWADQLSRGTCLKAFALNRARP